MKLNTIVLASFLTAALTTLGAVAAPLPNFIVILTDYQGWGTTSVLMDPLVSESKSDFFQTPNIEKLAASGMRFSQAYASHCNCSPSRASLQTGRSPAALHLTDIIERDSGPMYEGNKLIPPQHVAALSKEDKTIPQLLKAAHSEYRAAHFGKWHLAGGGPQNFGYDVSDGPTGNGAGNRLKNLPDDPKKIFSVTRRAIDFMQAEAKAGHPFYLQISHYATHEANQSRPATREKFQQTTKGNRHDNVAYGAMLADLDTGIGQLLEAVKAAGIADHTYIIYTADNGSVPTEDPGSLNGPLHGYKASVWEGGIRVPFMVTGPGIKADTINRTPVVGYDILPTICDLAGIATWPKTVEGGSLKPVLLGENKAVMKRPEDFLVFHWPHYQHGRHSTPDTTILADGWKLHYWWETGQTQLFQLDQDLRELKDLTSTQAERTRNLTSRLTNYLATIRAQLPTPNLDYKPNAKPGSQSATDSD